MTEVLAIGLFMMLSFFRHSGDSWLSGAAGNYNVVPYKVSAAAPSDYNGGG